MKLGFFFERERGCARPRAEVGIHVAGGPRGAEAVGPLIAHGALAEADSRKHLHDCPLRNGPRKYRVRLHPRNGNDGQSAARAFLPNRPALPRAFRADLSRRPYRCLTTGDPRRCRIYRKIVNWPKEKLTPSLGQRRRPKVQG